MDWLKRLLKKAGIEIRAKLDGEIGDIGKNCQYFIPKDKYRSGRGAKEGG